MKRPHGIHGAVLVAPASDDPSRFSVGSTLRLSGSDQDVTVVATKPHAEGVIVHLDGYTDRTAADGLRHRELTIAAHQRRHLGVDEYWPEDLVGRLARSPDGTALGLVSGVVLGDAQDRLEVTTADGTTVEVPFVSALVPGVSTEAVTIDPPEGMFD
ncbi:MAG: 16S rRNA processing protein RimM [Acidimicrobiia bacterium]|nr:16S rRNA processing protein RimM [Acidimicrobiia bacterium]